MKLNFDCIRDILLSLENLPYEKECSINELLTMLHDYNEEDVHYSCLKLHEVGFINAYVLNADGAYPRVLRIYDITMLGHEFLNDIHSDTIWNNVKDIAKDVGVKSIQALTEIATGVVTNLISSKLSL